MDDQRDYAEEAYNRALCPECGDSPCRSRCAETPFTTHECWEHETVAALRDLRDGRTVCDSPEHDAQGCAETLEQHEQSLAMIADMLATTEA